MENLNTKDSLGEAIKTSCGLLLPMQGVNREALLWALAGNESTFGRDQFFVRSENAYSPPNGIYFKKSQTLQNLYKQYGVLACSSFGAWQIMFITASELGYNQHPVYLQVNKIAIIYVINLLNKRIISHGATCLEDVFDAYNSGNFKDNIVPSEYIQKGIINYNLYMQDSSKFNV